jgi:hypothetical protein
MRLTYVIPAIGFCLALLASAFSVDAKDKVTHAGHCPPGLAKKSPACIAPGQAKKFYSTYRVGDRISGDYVILDRPGRYGLNPSQTYYRVGDDIFRVNQQTREVLDVIGAVGALLD